MGEMGESGRRRKQASELSAGVVTGGPPHTIPVRTPGEGGTQSQTPGPCSQQTQRPLFHTVMLDLCRRIFMHLPFRV